MTITYELGESLYINITNQCSNSCTFCVRDKHNTVNGKDSLWLEREPDVEEIIADLETRELSKYESIVFCGFGEPLMRFDDCINVAKHLKKTHPEIPVRINTNGQANLIEKRDITPEFEGIIDSLSISLNASNAKRYNEICLSTFGEAAFDGLLEFARLSKKYVPDVTLTIVDHHITSEEIAACRKLAESCGVSFRIRAYIE